jgi:hypothetical protein
MVRLILLLQGIYYLITGIWPLLSMQTFEAVTGPKTDDWLVQTVGALAATIGITIINGSRRQGPTADIFVLATLSAISFAAVDIVFASVGIISRIYLVDAAIQIVILVTLALIRTLRHLLRD